MLTVYGMSLSGNCYKVKLLLDQLGREYNWIEVNVPEGETRNEAFLARNPNGEVPVLEYAPGAFLPESNAILYYLSEGSAYWPAGRLTQARVLQWMFFEQYSHEPAIAVARFIKKFLPAGHAREAELAGLHERGYKALAVMEKHLADNAFFAGENYSIADISLFAYTHVAPDGGFDLSAYPALGAWLDRVRQQPGFSAMG